MSISTFSQFFYDFQVNQDQLYISFDEGSGELLAEVEIGNYSFEDGLLKVAAAMTDAGTQAYTATLNRSNRKVTIASVANFTLKIASSTVSNTLFSALGFSGSDLSGINSYASNGEMGSQYNPQFILQDYIEQDNFQKSLDPTVRKTASGKVEVVRFGVEKFIQMNIKFATNKAMDGKVIKNNANGVLNLSNFMAFAISKQPIEFMPDENDPNTFITLILERTPQEQNGTGFQLRELYDKNLPGFFDSGVLLFRVIE